MRKAALRPILGRDKVLRFLEAVTPHGRRRRAAGRDRSGDSPASSPSSTACVDSVITIDAVDGVVGSLYFVRNPDKLTRLDREVRLAR